ncbi:MAG TPA: hypothetical protein VHJ77_12980 [Vicinamibacterales bacterium]|nr:hypothetical protein [Vicinamibacterales bacterium]
MPSPDTILNGLTTIANDWRWLAITWHVLLAALLVVLVAGWRPSTQLVGHLLVGPLLSVSVLAWLSGNPFSGRVFAVLAALLVATATRFPNTPVQFASPAWVAPGVALIMFGWTYPHFVGTDSPTYLYASPFGTLPCPTLSVVIGMTLLFRNLRSRLWSTGLVVTGLLYGAFGVFRLGVVLDWGLLAASALLATDVAHDHIGCRSVRADLAERTRRLPGDEFIPEPLGTLTHAITIGRAPRDVWPWLIQMGAGSRAGWYSYDVLDNGGRPSATRVVPQLQDIAIGTLFPALPGVTEGFAVLAFEPNRSLILGWPNSDGQPLVTWAFVLEARDSHTTKLIVRARGGQSYRFHGLPWWLSKPIVHVVHFAMQRKQLLGIARRVESSIMTMPDAGPASESRRQVA